MHKRACIIHSLLFFFQYAGYGRTNYSVYKPRIEIWSIKHMNKTNDRISPDVIAVDIEKLSAILSCGCATARKIGEQAEARIFIGRRVLYSVSKVQKYLESIAE